MPHGDDFKVVRPKFDWKAADVERLRNEGREAAMRGEDQFSCPYPVSRWKMRQEWIRGYLDYKYPLNVTKEPPDVSGS